MPLFKKKLSELEAPNVLAEIIKVIIKNSMINPATFLRQVMPLPLPTLPTPIDNEKFAEALAKMIANNIPRDTALQILKEIKEQLKDYKI